MRRPPVPLLVQGGAAGLAQVLVQLLLEAAAAIQADDRDRNEVTLDARADGPDALVEVRDTGPLIAPEILSHVFNPYYRPNPGFVATAGSRGEGLALAACHGLVEAAGGSLTAESAEGLGTVFRIRLRGATSRTRVSLRGGDAPRARARVLVVCEDPLSCAGLYRSLAGRFDVVPHTSAVHAAGLLEQGEQFHAVVCNLPCASGMRADFHQRLAAAAPALARAAVHLVNDPPDPAEAAFLGMLGLDGFSARTAPTPWSTAPRTPAPRPPRPTPARPELQPLPRVNGPCAPGAADPARAPPRPRTPPLRALAPRHAAPGPLAPSVLLRGAGVDERRLEEQDDMGTDVRAELPRLQWSERYAVGVAEDRHARAPDAVRADQRLRRGRRGQAGAPRAPGPWSSSWATTPTSTSPTRSG
ncbi:MAG: ATP-binding protein [Anaeromyxobacter sp.]